MPTKILAFDLGAESGRALIGRFDGERVDLDVVHRFANGGVDTLGRLHWDILRLYGEMLAGLRKAGAEHGPLASVGVDTWGVDFGLIGRDGSLLGNPRHYRDPHTETIMDAAFARVPRQEVFRQTGIQFMRFNTLFQLIALQRDRSPLLEMAESMLLIPDLLHYWFTGVRANEYSNASTSQMIDAGKRTWAVDLIRAFGLPERILGNIVQPGTTLGNLHPRVAAETSVPATTPVIVPATHDTASAVVACPARGDAWAYISSGTWSLMGTETRTPMTDERALAVNFTNEGGVDGTIRLLKNIMGLWLVQECRRAWEKAGKSYSYEELMRLADAAAPFVSLVNPDDPGFILPASMPDALAAFCTKSGQPAPREPGAVVRCALESLALRYRWVLGRLEDLVGKRLEVIHIVGGGCQNTLLCQHAADACDRPVVAGPVEATALGNVLMQAVGLKLLGSLEDARAVVRRSSDVRTYEPRHSERWQEPYQRFLKLI
jgi:rhamnulokinase